LNERCVVAGMVAALVFSLACPPVQGADNKSAQSGSSAAKAGKAQVSRGRYMLAVGSCNDCHTADFAQSDGKLPEKEWLLGGGPLGFSGPWGTTYAPNLRLTLSKMSEDEWVKYAKGLKTRPPMPWFNLNQWADSDLRAFYQYVKQLGPVGDPVPAAYVPPDRKAPQPYIQWPMPPAKSEAAGKK
jgi:mono/diheme cytochrome c family protein